MIHEGLAREMQQGVRGRNSSSGGQEQSFGGGIGGRMNSMKCCGAGDVLNIMLQ